MAPPRSVAPPDDAILDTIESLTAKCGRPPSVRQLADEFGFAAPGPMHRHLLRLRREGLVTWDESRARETGRSMKVVRSSVSTPETEEAPPRHLSAGAG